MEEEVTTVIPTKEAKRDYDAELKANLPELKKIEGYPIGTDEDILALSKPPFYTACPNPFINEFIEKHGRSFNEDTDRYHCDPFVGDVSEGKNNPIYNAHSYHTKVPHTAIKHYIKHYTSEHDIILDCYSGTGMTGVAASQLNRNAILLDIAPISTFISANYNDLTGANEFKEEFSRIYNEVHHELGWVYETNHSKTKDDGRLIVSQNKGVINYVVWSDVFRCPFCEHEFEYYSVDNAKDETKGFKCPSCSASINKDQCERVKVSYFDSLIESTIEINKQVPALINYTYNKKRFEKKPDDFDLKLLRDIEQTNSSYWLPIFKMMFKDGAWGDIYRAGYHFGVTHSHHFYTKRNLLVLGAFWAKASSLKTKWAITSILNYVNKRQSYSGGGGGMPGVLFIASLVQEKNVFDVLKRKAKKVAAILHSTSAKGNSLVSTQSATDLRNIKNDCIDYIFTDPPFGDNIMYSEASFLWESWLKIFTANKSETIINNSQNKLLEDYFNLILSAFKEYYRVLKPKRWITVEFHNSKSKVWNAIQDAIIKSGFMIAQVSVLDKKQGSFKQVTAAGAVKSDLVISAFKPNRTFAERFLSQAGVNLEIDFINEFLSMQPIKPVLGRTEKMLYSKTVAYYVQRGYEIRYDAKSFYHLLSQHFAQEDGFWFTSGQINSYIEYKKKMKLAGMEEIKSGAIMLFVTDEKSAILWLYNFLFSPKTFSEVHTAFTQLANIQDDLVPELRQMLEENFINENGTYRRPKDEPEHDTIADRRSKLLQREFESLLIKAQTEKGKIKLVRKEALALGFENCYKTKRFQDILTIAKKLDRGILESSSELNDFVEAAEIMVQGVK